MMGLEESVKFIQDPASDSIDQEGANAEEKLKDVDALLTRWTTVKKSLNGANNNVSACLFAVLYSQEQQH